MGVRHGDGSLVKHVTERAGSYGVNPDLCSRRSGQGLWWSLVPKIRTARRLLPLPSSTSLESELLATIGRLVTVRRQSAFKGSQLRCSADFSSKASEREARGAWIGELRADSARSAALARH